MSSYLVNSPSSDVHLLAKSKLLVLVSFLPRLQNDVVGDRCVNACNECVRQNLISSKCNVKY